MAEEVIPDDLDITDELIAERRAEEPGQTPDDMTPWQRPITAFIDVLNMWAGRLICLLLVPLILPLNTLIPSGIHSPAPALTCEGTANKHTGQR